MKGKKIEIYSKYKIYKVKPSKENFRRYVIAGKLQLLIGQVYFLKII